MAITEFKDQYRFLSNFWPCTVWYDGLWYPSVEHAYVASKTTDREEQKNIQKLETPGAAKRYGRRKSFKVRPDFDAFRLNIMSDLVFQKFSGNAELRKLLLETGDELLVEGNEWGDVFWGVSGNFGSNWLGKILMEVRAKLRAESSALPGEFEARVIEQLKADWLISEVTDPIMYLDWYANKLRQEGRIAAEKGNENGN